MNIDCREYADEILAKVKAVPNKKALGIITVGNDPASESYVKGKKRDCKLCDIECYHVRIDEDERPDAVADIIQVFNNDPRIGGIILQLPTPYGSDVEDELVNLIDPAKDVDGFRADSPFNPCTPEGIIYLLKKQYGDLDGRDVILIGRGRLVGKPLINMLLAENCTVTIAHSHTKYLKYLIEHSGEILITATDKIHSIDLTWVIANTVIDAGIGYYDGKLCGNCYGKRSGYWPQNVTPVPGGVGLLTRAMLMAHIAKASDPTFTYEV